MTIWRIADAAAAAGLAVLGALHAGPQDGLPAAMRTIVLLGPDGPAFWGVFGGSAEFADGAPHALDRWSRRVVGNLADAFGGLALYPFGGPPWQPFIDWARRSGHAWESPVGLIVHDRIGLFVSYRGALAVPERLHLPGPGTPPCDACAQPCLVACPAQALSEGGYDVPACHGYLDTGPGSDCLTRGCAVRRACPVGRELRPEAQSAFHMAAFHSRDLACDD